MTPSCFIANLPLVDRGPWTVNCRTTPNSRLPTRYCPLSAVHSTDQVGAAFAPPGERASGSVVGPADVEVRDVLLCETEPLVERASAIVVEPDRQAQAGLTPRRGQPDRLVEQGRPDPARTKLRDDAEVFDLRAGCDLRPQGVTVRPVPLEQEMADDRVVD